MNVSLPPPKRHSDTEFVSTNWTQPLCVSQQFIKTIGKQKLVLPITYRNYLYQQITQIIKSHSHWFSPVIPEELYSQIIHTPSFINVNAKQSGNYIIQMTGLRLLDSSIEPILETFFKEPSPTQSQSQTQIQIQKVSKSLVSETSSDITPNIHSSSLDNLHITHSTPETSNIKQKLQDENEPDNEDNNQEDETDEEDEDEEQSLSLDYLKDMDDVEEWEPPIENTRILETSSQSQSQEQEQSSVIHDDEGWIDPDSLIETIEERMRQTQIDLEKLKKLRKLTSQSNQHQHQHHSS
jgi:hypothetical protein